MKIQNIAVYLGSSGHSRPIFKQTAENMGRLIAQKEKSLIYGGMDAGLMGILADSALKHEAHVTGVIPETLRDSDRTHKELNKTIIVQTLRERKIEMFQRMDASITLPGGYGTADEMLEILHWASLGLHKKPSVLVNTEGYYDPLITFMKECPDLPDELFIIAETPEEALEKLETWALKTAKTTDNKFPNYEDEIILKETDQPLIFEKATIKNAYILSSALSLKQLGRHQRPIGILDPNNKYALFVEWIKRARNETFVTKHCLDLFSIAPENGGLWESLASQPHINIDLALEKWGK